MKTYAFAHDPTTAVVTVGQLIEKLSELDPNAAVVGCNPPHGGLFVIPQEGSGAVLLAEAGR